VATRFLAVLAFVATAAWAQDTPLDRHVMELSQELRCLVCQNQTLAESNATLAVDLRNQIKEQVAAGKSDREVIDFLVERYGDFVLYRPPFKAKTLILWVGPFVFLIAGLFFLVRFLRRRRVPEPELSPADRKRAAKLLE
jgi:cytochrome c-type biogenesis protein CcmH